MRVSATAIRTTLRHGMDPARGHRPPPGGRSYASRPPGSLPATSLPSIPSGSGAARPVLHGTGHSASAPGRGDGPIPTPPGSPSSPHLQLRVEEHRRRMRFLIGDGAAQFCRGFDEVFRAEGAEVLVTAVPAPNANAYAERWLRSIPRGGWTSSGYADATSLRVLHESQRTASTHLGALRAPRLLISACTASAPTAAMYGWRLMRLTTASANAAPGCHLHQQRQLCA
jgi:hypothetical protein